ncbi:uncharacterized protein LALA0_S08e02058g [Lachancea lanzarotensis]|uniref:LALA0S08e02058g1_1 n=1 Tax=Lachancea lanzarotensis TaxID=1245769 RepID=A0A0C7N662_9SACH|nr:uncharacterized protein LALA0_S08e02058g [Lachancea lanzarotensis]CEP63420.1 LALA0S08e02058g1_1 [Lachancea lanzarotensis]
MSHCEFSEWRIYNVDEKKYYGSVGSSNNLDSFKFCLSANFEPPLVAEFKSEDVNKQALDQGIVVKTDSDVFATVWQLFKSPTSLLRLSLADNKIIVDCLLFGNVASRLTSETIIIDSSSSLAITQAIVKSLSCALGVQTGIVDHLHRTVMQKDHALAFLAASIRDLGFDDVIRRWAPMNSLNEKTLDSFDFEKWLTEWASTPDDSSKISSPTGSKVDIEDLMLRKVNVNKERRRHLPENTASTSFVADDFGSFNSETQNSGLSEIYPAELTKDLDEAVKIEDSRLKSPVSGLENISEAEKDQNVKRQQTPSSDVAKSSSPETVVDRSPNKKKRKFGRVRVD